MSAANWGMRGGGGGLHIFFSGPKCPPTRIVKSPCGDFHSGKQKTLGLSTNNISRTKKVALARKLFFDVFLGVVGVLGHRGFTIVLMFIHLQCWEVLTIKRQRCFCFQGP